MLKEHGEIIVLLAKLNKTKSLEDFKKFKDKQDKHILAEEKAIFIFYRAKEIMPVLTKILKQHEELNQITEEIERHINQDIEARVKKLRALMAEHISLEDRSFYPQMDKKLSQQEQEKILEKARGYILGNIALD